jgi:hypothetical protein
MFRNQTPGGGDSPPIVKLLIGGVAPATPGFNAEAQTLGEPEVITTSGVSAAPSALRSHPCVALSSAELLTSVPPLPLRSGRVGGENCTARPI